MNGFIRSIKQFTTWGPHLYGYINLVPPHQGSQLGSSWVQVSICKFIYTWGLVLIRFKPRSETHKHTHTLLFVSLQYALKLRYLILNRTFAAAHPPFHWGHLPWLLANVPCSPNSSFVFVSRTIKPSISMYIPISIIYTTYIYLHIFHSLHWSKLT